MRGRTTKTALAAALGALAALVLPAAGLAVERHVTMQATAFKPASLVVLPGDRVTWTNTDFRPEGHTVTGGPLASGTLARGQAYSYDFSSPGLFEYRCTLHPFMRGSVRVTNLHLAGPSAPVPYNRRATLSGLAQPGTAVAVTRLADGAQVAAPTAGADGSFHVSVPAVPGQYQASASGQTSSAVRVRVRPRLGIAARRAGTRLLVTVRATPSQAGARVVVERRARSRWVRLAGGRLNRSSKATFRVGRKAMRIRARTTRAVGGYERATSRTIAVR